MIKKLKYVVGLIAAGLVVLTTTGCSKDEFFCIDDAPCIDLQRMHVIAESDLFIDYQKACLLMANELNKIDSTKRGRLIITDEDTLYENVHFYCFKQAQDLLDSLLNMYPELKDVDQADLKEIQEIALSNNRSLKRMMSNNNVSIINWTGARGDNYYYSSNAIEWIQSLAGVTNRNEGSSYYLSGVVEGSYYNFELVPSSSIGNAMSMALIWSRNHEGVEVGGFGWSDSGLMMYCNQTTEDYMPRLPATAGNPEPSMDFILHPNGWLYPTNDDLNWWMMSDVNIHFIISPNHEVAVW